MALATQRLNQDAVVFRPRRTTTGMNFSTPNQDGGFVFHPPRRHGHHRHHSYYHNHSDCDTDSTSSRSSCSSDSDDDGANMPCHHVSYRPRHHATRRSRRSWWRWPRGVVAYPGYSSPWATTAGAGVIDATGLVPAPAGLLSAAPAATTVLPQQVYLQQPQAQTTQQQQQQQPRRYGYRRFHYQGGERVVRRGCGHGHHHHHQHHHQHPEPARSPRRCILPRFGRWLIGDPPERQRGRRCEDGGADCCNDGCGAGAAVTTTPTVHHEDEYWGPGVREGGRNVSYNPPFLPSCAPFSAVPCSAERCL